MRIEYLADHLGRAPQIAGLHYAQWRELLPDWSEKEALEELLSHRNRCAIPTSLIAVQGSELVGTVSLVVEDHDELLMYSPWLANLYVVPSWRGQGVGTMLVGNILEEARALGISRLYLYTDGGEGFYLRLGWRLVERVRLAGKDAAVLVFDLLSGRQVPVDRLQGFGR